jgi:hypothetical protein
VYHLGPRPVGWSFFREILAGGMVDPAFQPLLQPPFQPPFPPSRTGRGLDGRGVDVEGRLVDSKTASAGVALTSSSIPAPLVTGVGSDSSNAAIAILAAGVVVANATASRTTPTTAQGREAQVGIRNSASPDLMVSVGVMVIGP